MFLAVAAVLAVSPAFAQDESQVPLPAGHAAGTVEAPLVSGGTLWWVAGAVVVAAAVAIPLSSHHSSSTTKTTH
jgi:hypothetical protein